MSVQYINAWQYEPDLAYTDDPDIDGLLRIMLDNNIDFPTTSKGYLGLLQLFIDDRAQNASEEEQLLHIREYMKVPVPQQQPSTPSTPEYLTADEYESTKGNASSDASSLKNADAAVINDSFDSPTTSTPKKVAHLSVDISDDDDDDFDKPLVVIEEELDEVEKILVGMNLNDKEKEKAETSSSSRKRAHDDFSTSPIADAGAAHDSDNDSELSVSEIMESMSSEPFLPQRKKPRVNTPDKTYRYELASIEKEIAKAVGAPQSELDKDQQEEKKTSVIKKSIIPETSTDIKSVTPSSDIVSVGPSVEKESATSVEAPQSYSDKDQQDVKTPVIKEFVTLETSFTHNTVDIVTVKQYTDNRTNKSSETEGSSLPLISESILKVPQRPVIKFAPTPPPRRHTIKFSSSMFSTPVTTPVHVEKPVKVATPVFSQPKASEKIFESMETPKRPTIIPAVNTSVIAVLSPKAPEKLNESMETPKRPPPINNSTTSPGRRPRFTGAAAVERVERLRQQSGSEKSLI